MSKDNKDPFQEFFDVVAKELKIDKLVIWLAKKLNKLKK